MNNQLSFQYNDGGRHEAGFKGSAGDCVVRAISIAFQKNYLEVYEFVNRMSANERTGKRKRGKSSARSGVYRNTIKKIMDHMGAKWTPIMGIGTGCTAHMKPYEVPMHGRYILSVSKHLVALIDGVIHDTHNCSRDGKRCVYGYWKVG